MMQITEVPPFVDAIEMPQKELREVVQIDPPVPINVAPVVPPHVDSEFRPILDQLIYECVQLFENITHTGGVMTFYFM